MLNKKDTISYLRSLGLSHDEAKVYLELLKAPASHLELARTTGVNRTKVYRIIDDLEKRSLATARTDDRGTLLTASDPATLEVGIVNREETVKSQRQVFQHLLPSLQALQQNTNNPHMFSVQTYDGTDGFKQMLWHELKAEGEILIFGSGSLESLVESHRWAEKHRQRSVEVGQTIRELINPGEKIDDFTQNDDFVAIYNRRILPVETLVMQHQVVLYNNTVASYWWRDGQKVGVEIINKMNAQMMRQMFEHYWNIAE
jgi:sugar-specific transcriptional regulator TrmB